jgi:hypothetical protein
MTTHLVLKKLPGPNGELVPGTEVDASEWRNLKLLVEQRYLKPLDGVEAPANLDSATALPIVGASREQIIATVAEDLRNNGELAQIIRSMIAQAAPVNFSKSSQRDQSARR